MVALLAEGVDRNSKGEGWHCMTAVALLAEGVDRNSAYRSQWSWHPGSPSSRRAWIEIPLKSLPAVYSSCRPPRGGRG